MIQTIKDLVSAKADTTVTLAKEIWGYAELSYEETKSAAALISALKQEVLLRSTLFSKSYFRISFQEFFPVSCFHLPCRWMIL